MLKELCFVSRELMEKVKKDFVFISYCQCDARVKAEVKKLANFLGLNDVNVIYDRGGLEGGEELEEFQKLILHEKCKKVLIVCDKFYLERATKGIGGVGTEYGYIKDDYNTAAVSKYLPVTVKNNREYIISEIVGKISLDITDYNYILGLCSKYRINRTKENYRYYREQFEKYYNEADELSTHGDYEAAIKKVNMAILVSQEIRMSIPDSCKLFNLKLFIQIKGGLYDDTTIDIVNYLKKHIEKTSLEAQTRAISLLNCSIVYDYYDIENYAEKCAERAYTIVLNYDLDEQYGYALHLANLYFKYKAYTKALKTIGRAHELFELQANNEAEWSEDEYRWWLKINANECEMLTETAATINKEKRKKATEYTARAKELAIIILNKPTYEEALDDCECATLYEMMSRLFMNLCEFRRMH